MPKTERIHQIDLFRFLAAMGIVCVHYLFRGYKADNLTNLNLLELGGEWVKYCFVAIDLFFIISGFVIALSVRNKSVGHFFRSRVMRIFSVYWLCVCITYTVTMLFGAPRFTVDSVQLIFNLLLLQDFLNIPALDGAYWTMSVEVRFYCLALGYLILYRFKQLKIITLVYWWLALSVVYPLVQHLFLVKVIDLFLMFKWSSAFAAGIIMGEVFKTKKLKTDNVIGLLVCFALTVYHRLIYVAESRVYFQTDISDTLVILVLLAVYLLMLAVVLGKLKWLNQPYFLTFGLITYPLYLLHQRIGYIIFNSLMYDVNKYVLLGGTVILMLIASFLIVRWVAPWITKILDRGFDSILNLTSKKNRGTPLALENKVRSAKRDSSKK